MNRKNFMTFIFLGVALIGSLPISAQKEKSERDERLKALKIAFITEKLELDSETSAKFWPVYNLHEKEERKLKAGLKPNKPFEEITEEEALAMIDKRLEMEKQMLSLNHQYVDDLKQVLSAKQIAMLFSMDREFKRQMLRGIHKKRKGEKKNLNQ